MKSHCRQAKKASETVSASIGWRTLPIERLLNSKVPVHSELAKMINIRQSLRKSLLWLASQDAVKVAAKGLSRSQISIGRTASGDAFNGGKNDTYIDDSNDLRIIGSANVF